MFCYALLLCVLSIYFCNHLEEEERAFCFAFIVLRMSCYCDCYAVLYHIVVGWSSVYDCGIS